MFSNPWIMVPAVTLMVIKVSQKGWSWWTGRRARADFARRRRVRDESGTADE
jgi:hypothetical protein